MDSRLSCLLSFPGTENGAPTDDVEMEAEEEKEEGEERRRRKRSKK